MRKRAFCKESDNNGPDQTRAIIQFDLSLRFPLYTISLETVKCIDDQGPVVQSTVSLTSSLVVKMLTVLVSTISNSQVLLLKKCE